MTTAPKTDPPDPFVLGLHRERLKEVIDLEKSPSPDRPSGPTG